MIANRIGAYNKLVFLRNDGKIAIVNKTSGWQNCGLWYSNTYSLKPGYRDSKVTKTVVSTTMKSVKSYLRDKESEKEDLLDKAYAYRKHIERNNIIDKKLESQKSFDFTKKKLSDKRSIIVAK